MMFKLYKLYKAQNHFLLTLQMAVLYRCCFFLNDDVNLVQLKFNKRAVVCMGRPGV